MIITLCLIATLLYLYHINNEFKQESKDLGLDMRLIDWVVAFMLCLAWPVWLIEDLFWWCVGKMFK